MVVDGDASRDVRTLAEQTDPQEVLHQIVKAQVQHSRANDTPPVLRPDPSSR